ncbi:peptidase M24 [Dissophora ornata]|nr:peptidase M24 [Dissophora ornata]
MATRTLTGRLVRPTSTSSTTRNISSVAIKPTSATRIAAGSRCRTSSYQQQPLSSFFSGSATGGQIKSAPQYGQPTWMTHPHLMNQGEITPGLTAAEYELRRTLLMESLPKGSVVISTSHRTRFMTNNIFYPFHQQTDFYYLCGFNEPDAALVLEKNDSPRGYKMTMFVAPKNVNIEMWEGARTGLDAAKEIFGADEAIDANLFRYRAVDMASRHENVYFDYPGPSMFMPMDIAKKLHNTPVVPSLFSRLMGVFGATKDAKPSSDFAFTSHPYPTNTDTKKSKSNKSSQQSVADSDAIATTKGLSPLVQELRVIKSEAEIKIMRHAGEISGKAFIETMKFTNPQRLEHQVYAKFDFECRMRGSQMMAYVPVVAGGSNALTMHYVNNDQPLKDGDLLLMDAGGELNGYASDITRTWPVNGKFTEAQKDLYEVVLNANKECIKLCAEEHGMSLNQIHDVSMRLTKEGLSRLGIKPLAHDIDRRLYPHHVGHYLGMDVHDTGDISRSRPLKEGMVITIEPGLYIPRDSAYPEKYQGIGIRIEDNVVIGKTVPHVLSVTAPKEVVDIEYCCASGRE